MHISVLLTEVINNLNLKEDSIVVDCTLGYGGHSSEILKRIKKGFLFAFDQDQKAIDYSTKRLCTIGNNYCLIKSNFKYLKKELIKNDFGGADAFLFDLGVSSPQLDEPDRGFSYHNDAKLDMRMDQNQKLSAYDVVNEYEEKKLVDIFYHYGEDKFARNIARNIVKARGIKPIETTLELVNIITSSVPAKERINKHPAKQIFQAIRIEVNDELNILEDSLIQAMDLLKVNGRMAVITFHSLEDKIVKSLFKRVCEIPAQIKGVPNVPLEYLPKYKLVTNKAIIPTDEEMQLNKRSHSAKLRIIEKIR